jgi:hypothetical protein
MLRPTGGLSTSTRSASLLQRSNGRPLWEDSCSTGNRASPPFRRLPDKFPKLISFLGEMEQRLSAKMFFTTDPVLAKDSLINSSFGFESHRAHHRLRPKVVVQGLRS